MARGRGAGGADLALGVRPLWGLQVQVAPLAPDQRSLEQSVEGTRKDAWSIPPAVGLECGGPLVV